VPIERKHSIVAAVEIYEFAGRAEAETSRVGDSAILAEWSGQRTVSGEAEDRAVAVTVHSAGAGDQDPGHERLGGSLCDEEQTVVD
jgi:hypothetical protein